MFDIDLIKGNADVLNMWEYYLGEKGSNGRYKCPFNLNERQKNISVKNNSWHCFSCGESGDIISLVSKMYNLKFLEAVIKICEDFGLAYSSEINDIQREEIERRKLQREIDKQKRERFEKQKNEEFGRLKNRVAMLDKLIDELSLKDGENYVCYSYSPSAECIFYLIKERDRINDILNVITAKNAPETSFNKPILDKIKYHTADSKIKLEQVIDRLFKILINGDVDFNG